MQSLKIQGRVLTSSNGNEYDKALERNSLLSVLPARYIARPANYSDITLVLAFAASQNPPLEIAVKGGGAHSSTWSSSDGGIVIDLSDLKAVTVSDDRQSLTVQAGAVWGDVYEECKKAGVDVVGAPLWFVGVGGFLLGGGYGPLSGQRGLAIDNMLSATVVLADGKIVKTSATQESDLFWAIRGGGGQFGILAEVELKAFPPVGPITTGILVYPGTERLNVLKVLKDWKKTYTGKEKLNMTFSRPGPHFKPAVIIMPWISEDPDMTRSKALLAPFREGPIKPLLDKCGSMPDMLTASHSADASLSLAPKRLRIRGTLFADYYDELIVGVWERWVTFTENEDVRGCAVLWDLTRSEKTSEIGSGDTAMRVRENNYWVAVQGRTNNPAADAAVSDFVSSTVTFIRNKNTELSGKDYGLFLSMAQGDEKPEDVFGENLSRLRKLKAKYDPKNVFMKGISITPAI
ncbi:FAD-binding domain-containing protein [Lyophyllum atratum]|nr:FAD-binding domain-containing protein [Lyophyllum atratum]